MRQLSPKLVTDEDEQQSNGDDAEDDEPGVVKCLGHLPNVLRGRRQDRHDEDEETGLLSFL